MLAVDARLLAVGAFAQCFELARHLLHLVSELRELSGDVRYVLVDCDGRQNSTLWENESGTSRRPRERGRRTCMGLAYEPSTFTARAATSSTVTAEIADSRPIIAFARSDSGIVSVGLNAIAFVSER